MINGRKVFFSVIFILFPLYLLGQEAFDAEKTFFDANYHTLYNQFDTALDLYKELENRGYGNENIFYLIGKTYLHIPGLKSQAIPWLAKAVQNTTKKYNADSFKESHAPVEAWLWLGQAYQVTGDLEKARSAYQQYKKSASAKKINTADADRYLESCDLAEQYRKQPGDVAVSKPGFLHVGDVNYNIAVSADGMTIVFMSDTRFYHAIYYTQYINGHWTNPRNITMELESDGYYTVSSLTADGQTLLLYGPNGNNGLDIYRSDYVRNRWEKIRPVNKRINTFHNEKSAFLSPDRQQMFFVSDRPGGLGGWDIYTAHKSVDGSWDNITNLGAPVDTPYDEDSPFLGGDGKKLYFSSNGHPGMGGYDVFRSEKNTGVWGTPENLGSPPNTTDDDLGYIPVEKNYTAYMTVYGTAKEKESSIDQFEFFSAEHPHTYPVSLQMSANKERQTQENLELSIANLSNPNDYIVRKMISPSGILDIQLPPGKYTLYLTSPSYEPYTSDFTVGTDEEGMVLQINPVPRFVSEELTITYKISPVYFDFDRATLTPEAIRQVQHLKMVMDSVPELSLVIQGFTDNIGTEDYNQRLSEQRAHTVASYLTSHGIEHTRMIVKGMGETQPVAVNRLTDGKDCPEGRRFNRRVTFQVEGSPPPNVIFLEPDIPVQLQVPEIH